MHLYAGKRHWDRSLLLAGLLLACAVAVLAVALTGTNRAASAAQAEDLQNALVKATVTCYAMEGAYPPSLAYLEENYGVYVDTSRYTVRYSAVAANLMPVIRVAVKEEPLGD